MARDWATQFKNVFFGHDDKHPNNVIAGGSIASQQEIHHNSLPYRKILHSMTPHGGPAYGYGRDTSARAMNPTVNRSMYHNEGRPVPYAHQLQAHIVDPGQRIGGMDTNGSSYLPAAQHAVMTHPSDVRGNVPPLGPASHGTGPRDSAPRLDMSPGVMMPQMTDPRHMVPHTSHPRHAMPSRLGISKTSVPVHPDYLMHPRDLLSAQNTESYADVVEASAAGMSFVGNHGQQYARLPYIPSFGDVHAQGRSFVQIDSGLLHSRSFPTANISNINRVDEWNHAPGPEHHYKL